MWSFFKNQIKQLKLPKNIEIIEGDSFDDNQIERLDLSNYINLRIIKSGVFSYNQIKQLRLLDNIEKIEESTFENNKISVLDLLEYNKLKNIYKYAFSNNPLEEIKILGNIEIGYDKKNIDDLWNKFAKYYNKNGKKSGDYKYIDNKWQWYPL
jgi:hypothetical protein